MRTSHAKSGIERASRRNRSGTKETSAAQYLSISRDNSMDMGDRRESGKVTTREKAIGAPFWLTDDTQIPAQTEVWAITGVREIPRRGNPG